MHSENEPSGRIRFDAIDIDIEGHRLRVGDTDVPLERKAFAVLALLASHPGRVFTREEILDAVWGHAHVTPGVLNRIVTLLRQALGESAEAHRYVHTVHGVGYRFDRPVADAAAEFTDARDPTASGLLERDSRATASFDASAPGSMRRMVWFALPLAVLATGLWLWPRSGSAPVQAVAAEIPTLVVMPLKPIGNNASARVIADGLSEELICSLAKIDGLRVIAQTSTLLAATETVGSAQLAQRLGVTHTLEGNLQQSGQALRVRMRLVAADDGSTVWVKDFDREAFEVLDLQRDIAHEVADSLALEMGLAGELDVKSGDAEFLRRYMVARALLEREDLPPEKSIDVAEVEFRALLRERPDDARAHAGLALALIVASRQKPVLASALREESLREAMIARGLDPAQAESWSVEAQVACSDNEWERCLALRAKAFGISPSNAYVAFAYVFSLIDLGYLERAETIARELSTRDPLNSHTHLALGRILDARGQHDEARIELAKAGISGAQARWLNAAWRGAAADALRIAETEIAAREHPSERDALLAPGFVAASRALADSTLWPQATAEFDRLERDSGLWNVARVVVPDAAGHATKTTDHLVEARQRGYSSLGILLWAKDLAWLRRDPAFQHFLRDNGILAYWRKHGFPLQCRAQGDDAICE
jgi:TolB-like protein/DNA-binding winged helix-turn-helix (wHTH) protein/Flp pilus assembly protein TadD